MSEKPYIPLYIDDFDAHTSHLTLAEEGAYMRLLKRAWRTAGCSLPNDIAWIARHTRMDPEQFEHILKEYFKLSRGRWTQKRLKAIYDDIARKKLERSEAGKKGGANSALKKKENRSSKAADLLQHTIPISISRSKTLSNDGQESQAKGWENFRGLYPSRRMDDAEEAFRAAVGEILDPQPLIDALRSQVAAWKREGTEERYIPLASNWLEKGRWRGLLGGGGTHTKDWTGAADVRAAVVAERGDGFAVSYLDAGHWQDGPDGTPRDGIITTATNYACLKLLTLRCLRDMGVAVFDGSERKTG